MIKKRLIILLSAISLASFALLAFANDAPVVDITQSTAQASPQEEQQPMAASDDANANVSTNGTSTSMKQNIDAGTMANGTINNGAIAQPAANDNQSYQKAALPVPNSSTAEDSQPLSKAQRIDRLEQQMKNIIAMNLPKQVADIQQQLQQLNGQIQMQAHNLKLLTSQQRSFYQDLDQRIKQLQLAKSGDTSGDKPAIAKVSKPSSNLDRQKNNASLKEANAYQAAFSLLAKKQYPAARKALKQYLKNYPKGRYIANAHYWLGEVWLVENKFNQAASEFKIVIKQFQKSPKAIDAKLKLAIILSSEGKTEQAKRKLEQIKKQYPGSTAAQLATIRLQQLMMDGK